MNTSLNSNNLILAGTLTVDGGTLIATNSTFDVNGGVAISSGTLTAPSGTTNATFTVAGNWSNSGGTFTANGGKVTFDGTGQTISGSTTFYQLRKVVAAADTLTFTASTTQTVVNSLTLNGAAGQLLSLRSSATPTQANLILQAGGVQTINFVDVKDNNASGGLLLVGHSSVNSLNNTNWSFGGAVITWTGATSTDWDTPANWDLGFVPTASENVVIANTANQPILATNVTVTSLTVNSSANVTLNGKDFTATGTLTNNGTITRFGSEIANFGTMDTACVSLIVILK